jgi:hypothetical protein
VNMMWSKIALGVGVLMLLWAGWGQMNLGQAKQNKKVFDQTVQQGPFGRMPGNPQFKTQFDQQWKRAESGAQAQIVFIGVIGMLLTAGGGFAISATKAE